MHYLLAGRSFLGLFVLPSAQWGFIIATRDKEGGRAMYGIPFDIDIFRSWWFGVLFLRCLGFGFSVWPVFSLFFLQ